MSYKSQGFKMNLGWNSKASIKLAKSFLKSDLFKASLAVCDHFRIITSRMNQLEDSPEDRERAGAKFMRWVRDNILQKNHQS